MPLNSKYFSMYISLGTTTDFYRITSHKGQSLNENQPNADQKYSKIQKLKTTPASILNIYRHFCCHYFLNSIEYDNHMHSIYTKSYISNLDMV